MNDGFEIALIGLLPRMRRFSMSLVRNLAAAEDLVQSACLRALAARASWQVGSNFDAWVFRIIRNLWMDQLRHRKVTGIQAPVEETDDLVSHGADAETQLMVKQVRAAMLHLPDDMREIVSLVCIEELSYREVAEILDVPIGTVMSRLARARVKLAAATGYETGK